MSGGGCGGGDGRGRLEGGADRGGGAAPRHRRHLPRLTVSPPPGGHHRGGRAHSCGGQVGWMHNALHGGVGSGVLGCTRMHEMAQASAGRGPPNRPPQHAPTASLSVCPPSSSPRFFPSPPTELNEKRKKHTSRGGGGGGGGGRGKAAARSAVAAGPGWWRWWRRRGGVDARPAKRLRRARLAPPAGSRGLKRRQPGLGRDSRGGPPAGSAGASEPSWCNEHTRSGGLKTVYL